MSAEHQPLPIHCVADCFDQGALNPDRKIEPHIDTITGRIVDDVDAAGKGDAAINERQLAMHAAKMGPLEGEQMPQQLMFGTKNADVYTGRFQAWTMMLIDIASAEAVNDQPDINAALSSPAKRIGARVADGIVRIEISFEADAFLRQIDLSQERGEVIGPIAQQ